MDRRLEQGSRSTRPRRRPPQRGLEGLERRDLLAFTSAGISLPDLVVSGYSGPVAAWGGTLGVTVQVQNIGSSTTIEPLNLAPGSPSTADAPPTTVGVYLSPGGHPGPRSIRIGTVAIPAVTQNNAVEVTSVLPLPTQPRGFPGNGGRVSVSFLADQANNVAEFDETNNGSRARDTVLITPNLPDIRVVGLDVPPVMQPGDTIQPNIRLANYGSAPTAAQAPLVVRLVASLDDRFTEGDSTIAQFVVENLLPQSDVPTTNYRIGDVNVEPPINLTTLVGNNVTLPVSPGRYFIGVVVDPDNRIRELSETGRVANAHTTLATPRPVGDDNPGLPPAGVISAPIATVFPIPPSPIGEVTGPSFAPTFPFIPISPVITRGAAGSASTADGSGISRGQRARAALMGTSLPRGQAGSNSLLDRSGTSTNMASIVRGANAASNPIFQVGSARNLSQAARAKSAVTARDATTSQRQSQDTGSDS